MSFKNKTIRYNIGIFFVFIMAILLVGCDEGTGNKTSILGFLPSGIEVATGHKLLYNTDFRITTLIPFIEPLFCYIISIFCNLLDFCIWFIAWIPGVKQLIKIVYSLPDIDQKMTNIFPYHRNIITHSILNLGFILIVVLSFISRIKSEISEIIGSIVFLFGLIFCLHLLADSMPLQWVGYAKIYIGLGSFKLCYLPGFLSKAWLIINAIAGLVILAKVSDY